MPAKGISLSCVSAIRFFIPKTTFLRTLFLFFVIVKQN